MVEYELIPNGDGILSGRTICLSHCSNLFLLWKSTTRLLGARTHPLLFVSHVQQGGPVTWQMDAPRILMKRLMKGKDILGIFGFQRHLNAGTEYAQMRGETVPALGVIFAA